MIEHNVVVVGGVEHKAVKAGFGGWCKRCSIDKLLGDDDCSVCCTPSDRSDDSNVVFKRHYRPKHNELPIKVIEL